MGNIDKRILNDVFATSKIGLDSAEYLYGKVNNEELRNDINEYVKKYYSVLNLVTDKWEKYNREKIDFLPIQKERMWEGLQKYQKGNKTVSQTAEILLKGSMKGIVNITRSVNNEIADDDIRKIANTLIKYEKENILNMKKYL